MQKPADPMNARRSAVAFAALLLLAACKEDKQDKQPGPAEDPDGGTGVTRGALVDAVAACVGDGVAQFLARATELEAATKAWAAAPGDGTRDAARSAFTAAADAWQALEPLQIGPAASSTLPGGQNLREEIYSWPLVSGCAADGQIASRGYEAPTFASSLVNRRGLFVIEYLLHYDGEASQCPPVSAEPAGWAELTADEKNARRRAYAAAAAGDVRARATALAEAWDPAKGNFAGTLRTAGPGNAVYRTPQLALNAVSDALFYADTHLKDQKLARPLGLRDCMTPTCPERLESIFGGRSKANIAGNVAGLRRITEGCGPGFAGVGFDDLLESVGAEPVAARLRQAGAGMEAALAAIAQADLKEALAADPASVRGLHAAVKVFTDLLKTEIASVLNLELPSVVATDND